MNNGSSVAPLSGIRVADLSRTLAGTFCATTLADLGAEVFMVEVPSRGPSGISKNGLASTTAGGVDSRGNYECRSKKSITINIHDPKGLELFYEFVKHLDVVQYNWRAGTAERLGLDYDTLSQINPRVIVCSITGYGTRGPYRDRGSFDTVAAAHTGILSLTGPSEGPPMLLGQPIVDYSTAQWACQGILAALHHRERTGLGQLVEVSLYEVGLNTHTWFPTQYLLSGKPTKAPGWVVGMLSVAGIFQTSDGYIALGILGDRSFGPFCRVLGRPEWAEDPRFLDETLRMQHKRELQTLVREVIAQQPIDYWVERLVEARVPVAPVNTLEEALSDPQTEALGCIVTVQGLEGKPVPVVRPPINLSRHQPSYGPVPQPGQHTEEVLRDILGRSPDEVRQLQEEGIVAAAAEGL